MSYSTEATTPAQSPDALAGSQERAVEHPEGESAEQSEVEEQPPAKRKIDFAKRFGVLTRRERELQNRQREIAQKEKELQEKWSKVEEYEQAKQKASEDPAAFLQNVGLSYQQITEKILADEDLSTEEKIEKIAQAKIDQYAKQQEEKRQELESKKQEEQQKAKENEIIERYKAGIKQAVDTASEEELELVRLEGDEACDLAFHVASEHYDQTGEVLDPKVAIGKVEEYLEKRYKEVIGKAKKLSTVRGSKETQNEPAEPKGEVEQKGFHFAPKTLTNRSAYSSVPPDAASSSRGLLSDEESKAQAAETLRKALAARG